MVFITIRLCMLSLDKRHASRRYASSLLGASGEHTG